MQNLYTINFIKKEKENIEFKVTFSNENHKVFKAHFPNNPLLPGFMQIDILSTALKLKIIEIKKAKFLKPILPNDSVLYLIKIKDKNLNVKVEKENKKI